MHDADISQQVSRKVQRVISQDRLTLNPNTLFGLYSSWYLYIVVLRNLKNSLSLEFPCMSMHLEILAKGWYLGSLISYKQVSSTWAKDGTTFTDLPQYKSHTHHLCNPLFLLLWASICLRHMDLPLVFKKSDQLDFNLWPKALCHYWPNCRNHLYQWGSWFNKWAHYHIHTYKSVLTHMISWFPVQLGTVSFQTKCWPCVFLASCSVLALLIHVGQRFVQLQWESKCIWQSYYIMIHCNSI